MSKSIWLVAFVVAGVAVLAVGSPPAAADETDGVSQSANADSDADSEMSERQRRREERRRAREEAAPDGDAVATADDASEAGDGEKPRIVLVVEPEMECRKVVPPGSRMPKEVCTTVVQQDANERYQEEEAEAMLRRMREQSTRN